MVSSAHPWRIMTAVFAGVLLCSFAVENLFTPIGNAVVNRVAARTVELTGTIQYQPSRGYVLDDGAGTYLLDQQTRAEVYAGHKVRLTGDLHESTGLIEIRAITNSLDRSADAQ